MRRAFITGISGQDGSYLADLLLAKNYQVHGLLRPSAPPIPERLAHLFASGAMEQNRIIFHRGDLEDPVGLDKVIRDAAPDELYHLAGQSHVGLSFENPECTSQIVAIGTIRLLEIVRQLKPAPKVFHASSAQIFGEPEQVPQNEETPARPVNPYGCAKAFAGQMTAIYRRSYGLFTCNGILFNHESPRRTENFVTRKICRAAARIRLGLQSELVLGDLSAKRDWGHARDYVEGMWMTLQHSSPEDFVFATGQLHSVEEAVQSAFAEVQLDWRQYVRSDPALARPTDPHVLVGDASKAKRLLGWQPRVTFKDLIAEMTQADLAALA